MNLITIKYSYTFRIWALACLILISHSSAHAENENAQTAKWFVALAEAELELLEQRASRASFRKLTDETQEHLRLAEEADAAYRKRVAELAKEAKRFTSSFGLDLPDEIKRKLLRLSLGTTIPAPQDQSKSQQLSDNTSAIESNYTSAANCTNQPECRKKQDLYKVMRVSRDHAELLSAWQEWHAPAKSIRSSYTQMVEIANQGAIELGFEDVGALWRSHYDMPAGRFAAEYDRLWDQVKPLYDALHCHVRTKLRASYPDTVSEAGPIPAHLLGNMWAQHWTGIEEIVGIDNGEEQPDITSRLKAKGFTARDMVRTGESFFVSLGFPKLPATFWNRSMLTKPADKISNCHASAWDIDAHGEDVRLKMCIETDEQNFLTVHHELGHIYYYLAYKDQPFLFRTGANPGFHEAIGDVLARSITPSYLVDIGLLDEIPKSEADLPFLFHTALDMIPRLAMSIVVDKWRWGVFSGDISAENYNAAWWTLRKKYQGLFPPTPRSEDDFDAGMFFHISYNVPYDRYFIAQVLQFDIHRALCETAGKTGPLHQCSIFRSKAAGERLKLAMSLGASKPWTDTLFGLTGRREIDATSIVKYFEPVMDWLNEQNQGQQCGW